MDTNNIPTNPAIEKPKKSLRKFILLFLVIIISVVVLFFGGIWLWQRFNLWRGEMAVRDLAEGLQKLAQDDYARATADIYGGQTPQETMQMFTDAVEKGDYKLASKYFVLDSQEKEFNLLKSLKKEPLDWFIEKMLKGALLPTTINTYISEKSYRIQVPSDEMNVYYAEIEFFKYPKVWKINTISPDVY